MLKRAFSFLMVTIFLTSTVIVAFNIQTAKASDTIIDTHNDSRFTKYPIGGAYWWSRSDSGTYNGNFWYTLCGDAAHGGDLYWGKWDPPYGQYEVFVWIPNPTTFPSYVPTHSANYDIYHSGGFTEKVVNQALRLGGWYSLGIYTFASGSMINLDDRTGEPYISTMVAFDAIKFTPIVPPCTLTVSSAHDSPNPSNGAYSYSNGQWVTCSVTSPADQSGGSRYRCTGYTGTGSCPSNSGTSVTFTITQASTITWNWVAQYSLTVASAHDSPSPGVGTWWYDSGAPVICSVTSPAEGYSCTGWTGTGSVPSSGTSTSTESFMITQGSAITWNWILSPQADFSITAFPTSLTIQQGSSGSSTITITSINGFNQPVQLTKSGVPSGVTATLNPQQVTPPAGGTATSTLTVSVATTATPGSCTLTVTGISGELTHSKQISLEITAAPQNEWTFAIITDLHIGRGYADYNNEPYYLTARLQNVVDWIKRNHETKNIKFVVVLGDLTENGKPSELNKAKEILDHLNDDPERIPYFPVIGNHEIKQFLDSGSRFQDTFTNDFLQAQCNLLTGGAILDLNWRIQEPGISYQNYAFKYENKRFVFLDWVERDGMIGTPTCYAQTCNFLRNQLGNGDPTFLFSHHPMVDDYVEGAFTYIDINMIAGIIRDTNSGPRILGSFGGHIHSYFDPESAWNPNIPPHKNPMFLSTRNINYALTFSTPEGIPVYGIEALMSASYDPTSASRNVARIVEIKQNTIETYVDCECPGLNPYIYDISIITNPWFQPPITTCWFTFYAFYGTSSEYPIKYSMYLNGELLESPMSSSKIELVQSQGHVLGKGTYTLKLAVEGHARDGSVFSENISRTFTVKVGVAVVVACPVELVVTDPLGRSVGKSVDDIPEATYTEADFNQDGDLDKLIMIPTPIDGNYVFTLNGIGLGSYSMIAQFVTSQEVVSFNATRIPVSSAAIHQYTIDWTALSQGEEGVAVQVNSDGDSIFEYNFTSDNELNRFEYVAATTQHDLGITGLTSPKAIIGSGYSLPINMTIVNYGVYAETFNVTIYANTTLIASQIVTLANGSSITVTYAWNTAGLAKGNYTISAVVDALPSETYTEDNTLIGGWVIVTIPGDVDGDFENGHYDVGLYDAVRLLACYGLKQSESGFDINCDIDNDGRVTLFDAVILLSHYGQTYP